MNEKKVGFLYSWVMIFITCIVFWPVGIFLLWRRVSIDKTAAIRVGKILGIIGKIGYGFTAFCVIGMTIDPDTGFGVALFSLVLFGVPSFLLDYAGRKLKNNAEKVRKYIAVVINGNETLLANISSATGIPYETVKSDLTQMINKGYFANAYINDATGELVLAKPSVTQNQSKNESTQQANQRVVTCKCCGANNTITGTVGECEYCGSPLQ